MREKLHAFLRLLRFSNAPTTLADMAAGITLALSLGGRWNVGVAALVWLLSFAIYECGMVLNDLADYELDRRQGRPRPLVTGALSMRFARSSLLVLILVGLLAGLALGTAARIAGACLFLLVLLYNVAAKRHALAGPLALGACRAGNILLGAAAFVALDVLCQSSQVLWTTAAYGLYVASLSSLARMEDGTVFARRCRAALVFAAIAFATPGLMFPDRLGTSCHLLGAVTILRPLGRPMSAWDRPTIGRTVGSLLRLTVVFGAGVSASAGGPAWLVVLLLALYPLCLRLARTIPPT